MEGRRIDWGEVEFVFSCLESEYVPTDPGATSSVSTPELGADGQQIVCAGLDFAFDLATTLSESSGFSKEAHHIIWDETHGLVRRYASEDYPG